MFCCIVAKTYLISISVPAHFERLSHCSNNLSQRLVKLGGGRPAHFKVLHPNKRSSEHTQIMHMYLKIRKEGDKCHELPQYHQVLIEL